MVHLSMQMQMYQFLMPEVSPSCFGAVQWHASIDWLSIEDKIFQIDLLLEVLASEDLP